MGRIAQALGIHPQSFFHDPTVSQAGGHACDTLPMKG
jgi:hypothetical protein